jgi:hypothetical protein
MGFLVWLPAFSYVKMPRRETGNDKQVDWINEKGHARASENTQWGEVS